MSLETGGKIIAWCTLVGGSVGVFGEFSLNCNFLIIHNFF